VIYRDYTNGSFGDEMLVDSWKNQNYFIGDYSSIDADKNGEVGIGYTKENPSDNAMFAKLIPMIDVNVSAGWNLISIPWLKNDTGIEDALSTIKWDRGMVYDGEWHTFDRNRDSKYNLGLTEINNKQGVWIYAPENSILSGPGEHLGNTNIVLKKGWNLVGYPSIHEKTVSDALSGIPYEYVQAYNTTSGQMETLGPEDVMEPRKGYWVYVTENCEWTVEW
jgi:hypothetical protein